MNNETKNMVTTNKGGRPLGNIKEDAPYDGTHQGPMTRKVMIRLDEDRYVTYQRAANTEAQAKFVQLQNKVTAGTRGRSILADHKMNTDLSAWIRETLDARVRRETEYLKLSTHEKDMIKWPVLSAIQDAVAKMPKFKKLKPGTKEVIGTFEVTREMALRVVHELYK